MAFSTAARSPALRQDGERGPINRRAASIDRHGQMVDRNPTYFLALDRKNGSSIDHVYAPGR